MAVFITCIDGTVRIPSRQEVVDRTKVVIIQDDRINVFDLGLMKRELTDCFLR